MGEMEPTRIPIPRSQRWREFRLNGLPVLVFVVTAVLVARLWSERVSQANLTGVVVGHAAEIRSPAGGYLIDVTTDRFQPVSAGEVLGRIVTTDPAVLDARVAVILAEIDLLRLGAGAAAGHQRAVLNRESLEMDLMRHRAELAAAGLRRQHAERDAQRASELHARGVISAVDHDLALSALQLIDMEIGEKTALVGEMRRRLEEMGSAWGEAPSDPITAEIRRQEEELRLIEAEATPVPLVAPIDGIVARAFRLTGERVATDEPILVLRSERPEYIVGYLPQPLRFLPEVGMSVIVRSRARIGGEMRGRVVAVGAQIEDMTEVELLPTSTTPRTGLPIRIALGGEPGALRPGEIVQLTLRSDRADQPDPPLP